MMFHPNRHTTAVNAAVVNHVRRSRMALLLFTALLLGPGADWAMALPFSAGEIDTYIYNYDLVNNTGQVADGMQWRLDHPASHIETVFEFPPPNYPDSEVFSVDSQTTIVWRGSTTDPGGVAHFGVESQSQIESGVANWLDGDVPLSPGYSSVLPDWQVIEGIGGAGAVLEVSLLNPTSDVLWIHRRSNVSREALELEDLLVELPLYEGALPVDTTPRLFQPNSFLSMTLELDTDFMGYLHAFELFEDANGTPGRPIGTFLNAVNVIPVPEPATAVMTLLVFAVVAMRACLCAARHRYRRQRSFSRCGSQRPVSIRQPGECGRRATLGFSA